VYLMLRRLAEALRVDPRLKVFTAFYVLVGIGILVEIARRLGMGFIAARAELEAEKSRAEAASGSRDAS
jgi:hypothetical protein